MTDAVAPMVAAVPRVRKAWDIWLTIGLLLNAVVTFALGAVLAYLGLAFFGSCNSNGCSGDSLVTGFFVLIGVGIAGILASIVMLIIRRRGWPVALLTIGAMLIGWVVAIGLDGVR